MHSGPESLGGGPPSFTARRPHASNLPSFELPPPQLPHAQKYPYSAPMSASQPHQPQGTVASVGNLLTPPSNIPGDGISPVSTGVSSSGVNSSQGVPYTTNGGYVWSPPTTGGNAPYGFQTHAGGNPQQYPPRAPQQPQYDMNSNPQFQSSGSMSAPSSLPTMSNPQHSLPSSAMMSSQPPATTAPPQQSPVHTQEAFHTQRPPPTPTYYHSQQSSAPQQPNYHYSSTGPSPTVPTQPSPMSVGSQIPRMSPTHTAGPVPSLPSAPAQSPHHYQRPFGHYPLPGPVLSNINNPNGSMTLVGGGHVPHGMIPNFNSGHAANMPHVYGAPHAPQAQPPNDRPFKCDQCPQSFNRNHDLKRHKRIHLAVKPFPCGHCDKSFSRKDALKRHILVKGCGKATSGGDNEKGEKSGPPAEKLEDTADRKPVVGSHT
ncbi:hypothetical protein BDY21DRAFT_100364 [Lineolata rhizophorae]|uniref:C2H2-type domain-containing protein n=1 Tax=Lineolata rhizophorae TaxID=578093 RepID=A0A6A6NS83_9PEZI|nr:hypothetical protein BDY21DRAFT_100364 [Lineolata rhizophorae]